MCQVYLQLLNYKATDRVCIGSAQFSELDKQSWLLFKISQFWKRAYSKWRYRFNTYLHDQELISTTNSVLIGIAAADFWNKIPRNSSKFSKRTERISAKPESDFLQSYLFSLLICLFIYLCYYNLSLLISMYIR